MEWVTKETVGFVRPDMACPHCKAMDGVREADSDKLSWSMIDNRILKELWQCMSCAGYFFMYYELIKVVPLKEPCGDDA